VNDPIKIGVLWGIIGIVFGLVVMFGGKALIGGDDWYVIWPGMVLVFTIQASRVAYQKGAESKTTE
jgi:ascorbate-specific PTS system EIIC-type component UlaA